MKTPHTQDYPQSHIATSPTGNPLTKFVNLCQSPEERRDKYAFCREFGINYKLARVMRDWHWTKVNLLIQALNKTMPLFPTN